LDSKCFLSKTPEEAWDWLENLSWDNYDFEKARKILRILVHIISVGIHIFNHVILFLTIFLCGVILARFLTITIIIVHITYLMLIK